jgi:hypothetical protein
LALLSAATFTLVAFAAPAAVAAAVNKGCPMDDGGYNVQVCIYMDGTDSSTGGAHFQQDTNVTDYRIVVTNLDPHDVVLGSTTFRATVQGTCQSGCGNFSNGQIITRTFNPVSGTSYKYAVPWSAAWVLVDDAGDGAQAGRATVHFTYRGTAKTYESPSVCLGSLAVTGACNF